MGSCVFHSENDNHQIFAT